METKQLIWLIIVTFFLGIALPLSFWQGVRDGHKEVEMIQHMNSAGQS